MNEINDLYNFKKTINDISINMSSMFTEKNTNTIQNALKIATSNLSKNIAIANLATNQTAIKNLSESVSSMSSMFTATNTDAIQNALKIATSNLSKNIATANLATNQTAIKNLSESISSMSSMLTATNTDAIRNAMINTTTTKLNISKLSEIFDTYSDTISKLDWENFDPTEKDIQQAFKIIKNENVEETLSKELNDIRSGKETKNYIVSFIVTFAIIIGFLSDFITVIEFTEQRIHPAMQSLAEHVFDNDKVAIKWLNDELKQDIPIELSNNFRIVSKDELIVREGKKVDSKINGKLNSKDIIQVVEKKKNWTYIFYSDYKTGKIVEGWVFTRYLKQIK